jgi:hypothetical protein
LNGLNHLCMLNMCTHAIDFRWFDQDTLQSKAPHSKMDPNIERRCLLKMK